MNEEQFYQECAISALQGILEMGGKIGVMVELVPEKVAAHAFDIADHMLREYRKRKPGLDF